LRQERLGAAGVSIGAIFTRTSVALLWLGLWAAPCFTPQSPLVDRLAAAHSAEERARLLDSENASVNAAPVETQESAVAERLHDHAATSHAHFNVGRCLNRMGKSAEAIESLHTALAISGAANLDALSALSWRVLSTVYQQRGETAEALDAAERSRKLYQGSATGPERAEPCSTRPTRALPDVGGRDRPQQYGRTPRLVQARGIPARLARLLHNLGSLGVPAFGFFSAFSFLPPRPSPVTSWKSFIFSGRCGKNVNQEPYCRRCHRSFLAPRTSTSVDAKALQKLPASPLFPVTAVAEVASLQEHRQSVDAKAPRQNPRLHAPRNLPPCNRSI
jgi:tetratricopeptide (TPR) repeat protein